MAYAFYIKEIVCKTPQENDSNGDQISVNIDIDGNKNYWYAVDDTLYQGDVHRIQKSFECNSSVSLKVEERDATNTPERSYSTIGTQSIACNQTGEGIAKFNTSADYKISWIIYEYNFVYKTLKLKYIECIKIKEPGANPTDSELNGDELFMGVKIDGNAQINYPKDGSPHHSIREEGDKWEIGDIFNCKEAINIILKEGSNPPDNTVYATLGGLILSCTGNGEKYETSYLVGAQYRVAYEVIGDSNHLYGGVEDDRI